MSTSTIYGPQLTSKPLSRPYKVLACLAQALRSGVRIARMFRSAVNSELRLQTNVRTRAKSDLSWHLGEGEAETLSRKCFVFGPEEGCSGVF